MQIDCACGCGQKLEDRDSKNRPRKFISGHNRTRYGKRVNLICPVCNSEFERLECVVNDRKKKNQQITCSAKCRAQISKMATQTDEYREKQRQFALQKGMKPPMHSGEDHWNWQGGITNPNQRYEDQGKYAAWRKSVLRRDNFTCQQCGQRGGRIQAHHIKQWSKYPDLRFDTDNGMTVCEPCHKKIHFG